MQYLVDQYAKDDTLAPKEPKLAAMVNQRLYFDATTLYQRIFEYFVIKQQTLIGYQKFIFIISTATSCFHGNDSRRSKGC